MLYQPMHKKNEEEFSIFWMKQMELLEEKFNAYYAMCIDLLDLHIPNCQFNFKDDEKFQNFSKIAHNFKVFKEFFDFFKSMRHYGGNELELFVEKLGKKIKLIEESLSLSFGVIKSEEIFYSICKLKNELCEKE